MIFDDLRETRKAQIKYRLNLERGVSVDLITLFTPANKIGCDYDIYSMQRRLLNHKIETLYKSRERNKVFGLSEYDIKNEYFNMGFHENCTRLEYHEEESALLKIKSNIVGKYLDTLPRVIFHFNTSKYIMV